MKRISTLCGLLTLTLLAVFPFSSSPHEPLPSLASLTLPTEPSYYQQPVKTRWRADKAPPRRW